MIETTMPDLKIVEQIKQMSLPKEEPEKENALYLWHGAKDLYMFWGESSSGRYGLAVFRNKEVAESLIHKAPDLIDPVLESTSIEEAKSIALKRDHDRVLVIGAGGVILEEILVESIGE